MSESRKKNSSINLILALIKYTISIITAFTLRTLTLKAFGDVFSGLISLYSNIISILSITELGIGTALIYKLYKPVAENDNERTKTLLNVYKKVYYTISFIILGLGLLVLPFLNVLTKNASYSDGNIYFIFLFYLVNCVITYFVGHRKALLFTMQKNWAENLASSISAIVIFPVQIVVLLFIKNCYIYLFCSTLILIIESLIIFILSNKKYKEIKKCSSTKLAKDEKKELAKNTYAMACNKISNVAFKGVDSIIISSFLGVVSVFLYSNYYIILTYLFAILNLIFGAVRASVGNYVNTMPKEKVKELFNEFYFIEDLNETNPIQNTIVETKEQKLEEKTIEKKKVAKKQNSKKQNKTQKSKPINNKKQSKSKKPIENKVNEESKKDEIFYSVLKNAITEQLNNAASKNDKTYFIANLISDIKTDFPYLKTYRKITKKDIEKCGFEIEFENDEKVKGFIKTK